MSSYFPPGTIDDFRDEWYSKFLKAGGLRPLQPEQAHETYRFTWLRTFHHPVFVQVEARDGGVDLNVTELSGQGGYEPGDITLRRTVLLTEEQWQACLAQLTKAGFWGLTTDKDEGGCDGAEWVLEGARPGQYHVVYRWSPESGPFRAACLELLKMSSVSMEPLY